MRLKKLKRNLRRQELKWNYLRVDINNANFSNLLQILNLFSGVLWEAQELEELLKFSDLISRSDQKNKDQRFP